MLGLMGFSGPCTLFIDIISLFINWANKDACLLARQTNHTAPRLTHNSVLLLSCLFLQLYKSQKKNAPRLG